MARRKEGECAGAPLEGEPDGAVGPTMAEVSPEEEEGAVLGAVDVWLESTAPDGERAVLRGEVPVPDPASLDGGVAVPVADSASPVALPDPAAPSSTVAALTARRAALRRYAAPGAVAVAVAVDAGWDVGRGPVRDARLLEAV